jgi:hypothetical protein
MGRSSVSFGIAWSLVAAAALLACGGSQPAASSPSEPGAEPAATGGADVWSDSMSTKEKGAFMKNKVMPAMAKSFGEFDAKKYGDVNCKLCHGPNMTPKPVDFLPELHMKDGKLVEAEQYPEVAKFMHDKVVPEMAALFGKPQYDPATKSGFGCLGCHKISM